MGGLSIGLGGRTGRVGTSGLTPPGSIGAGLEDLFYRYNYSEFKICLCCIFTLGTISWVGVEYFPSVWICTMGDLGGGRRGEGRLAILNGTADKLELEKREREENE